MRYLYPVLRIVSNKRRRHSHAVEVNSSWTTGHARLVCQMCARSARLGLLQSGSIMVELSATY